MSVPVPILAIALALTVCTASASSSYRFTFTNPSIGHPSAPLVLEYFSVADCGPCRVFEHAVLPDLLADVRAGRLQVIFRDLPSANELAPLARQLFCAQELEDLVATRQALKQADFTSQGSSSPVTGRAKARWEACLEDSAAEEVAHHNLQAFSRRGFVATPAFVLTDLHAPIRSEQLWSGARGTAPVLAALGRASLHVSAPPDTGK